MVYIMSILAMFIEAFNAFSLEGISIPFFINLGKRILTVLLLAAVLPSLFLFNTVAAAAAPITSLTVKITTHSDLLSGTDNGVYLRLDVDGQQLTERKLDHPGYDDFERGHTDTFTIEGILIPERCKLLRIGLRKKPDDWFGGWKLAAVTIEAGGQNLHSESGINQWLEDDHREWWAATYVPPECPPPPSPPPPPVCTAPLSVCRPLNRGEKDIAIDTDCDRIPDECDAEVTPLKDSDCDGIPDVNEDYNGDGTVGPCESDPNNPDSDGDGILDGYEDQDGDGLPDWYEDVNRNCQVDPGESDPNNPDTNGNGTPDGQEDGDSDGIVDWLEDDYGTDPGNPDTDGDNWYDGPRNKVTTVKLTRIDTEETQESAFYNIYDWYADELFVTFNHTRWPEDEDLDGYWYARVSAPELLNIMGAHASPTYVNVEAARRTWAPGHGSSPVYSMRMDVREDDGFDWTDDDFILDRDINFTQRNQLLTEVVEGGSGQDRYRHILTFVVLNTWFADPHPTDGDADADRDGLTEATEFETAAMLNGVADLSKPDIYMELDWQEGQQPARFSKEDVSSRFTYHGYAFHLDDGAFGGGGKVTPLSDVDIDVSLNDRSPSLEEYRNKYFDSTQREGIFRYALSVEAVKDGYGWSTPVIKDTNGTTVCGRGDKLVFEDADFMNYFSDIEPIVWIHEFGHNLGLCHLPGDCGGVGVVVGPGGEGGCTSCTPPPGFEKCNCTHYVNSRWDDSAMGSCVTFPWIDDIIQAIDREIDYDESEWRVIDLTPIDGP